MGIWIRTQSKQDLVNTEEAISIISRSTGDIFSDPKDDVISYKIVSGIELHFTLGFYISKEEALKVLDMIQEYVYKYDLSRFMGKEDEHHVDPVFEMPPSGFSKAGDSE